MFRHIGFSQWFVGRHLRSEQQNNWYVSLIHWAQTLASITCNTICFHFNQITITVPLGRDMTVSIECPTCGAGQLLHDASCLRWDWQCGLGSRPCIQHSLAWWCSRNVFVSKPYYQTTQAWSIGFRSGDLAVHNLDVFLINEGLWPLLLT